MTDEEYVPLVVELCERLVQSTEKDSRKLIDARDVETVLEHGGVPLELPVVRRLVTRLSKTQHNGKIHVQSFLSSVYEVTDTNEQFLTGKRFYGNTQHPSSSGFLTSPSRQNGRKFPEETLEYRLAADERFSVPQFRHKALLLDADRDSVIPLVNFQRVLIEMGFVFTPLDFQEFFQRFQRGVIDVNEFVKAIKEIRESMKNEVNVVNDVLINEDDENRYKYSAVFGSASYPWSHKYTTYSKLQLSSLPVANVSGVFVPNEEERENVGVEEEETVVPQEEIVVPQERKILHFSGGSPDLYI